MRKARVLTNAATIEIYTPPRSCAS